jgi:hypothetical protein
MDSKEKDARNWKMEQLNYFKGYLGNFKENSREYELLLAGIRELEKHL